MRDKPTKMHLQRGYPIGGMVSAWCGKTVPMDRIVSVRGDTMQMDVCQGCSWAMMRARNAERRAQNAAADQCL